MDFTQVDILGSVHGISDVEADELSFGLIGFDDGNIVRRYNVWESKATGLSIDNVLGRDLFKAVALCMNNFMIAQRFEDAASDGTVLDTTIDYVLTFRMRPTKVKLRMLAAPGTAYRYVLIHRLS